MLFHFQLDWIPVPQKKLERKLGSGLVLEKKKTKELRFWLGKSDPVLKIRTNPIT
jgi:hypothetical protein